MAPVNAWASINGEILPGPLARVSIFDRGFLFGHSVYEVLRTIRGRPLFWDDHVRRLCRSAELNHLPLGDTVDELRREAEALLQKAGFNESYIRVIVSRGIGDVDIDPVTAGEPTRVIIVKPLPRVDPKLRRDGCALASFRTGRRDEGGIDPRAKTGSTMLAVLGQVHARKAGAYEALRIDPLGRVLECATSTFFMVSRGHLETPALAVGILEGITRRKVMEVARSLGMNVQERELQLSDLGRADEAFITSSVRGIVPVVRIDDLDLRAPRPVTGRLVAGYAALLDRQT